MTTTPLPPRPLEALRHLREVIPFRLNLEAKHQELYGNLKVIADCSERAAEDVVWCYAKWLEARADLEAENARLRKIAWLIGSIFVHGNFKAETSNERELENLLRENGTFWESLADFDARAALESKP